MKKVGTLNILLLQSAWLDAPSPQRYILAVDEVVQGKAGRHTHGVGWFYSSIAGKVIRAISHHVLSVVDTQRERSFVLKSQQTVKVAEEGPKRKKADSQKTSKRAKGKSSKGRRGTEKNKGPETAKGKAGRPKGSRNKQNLKEAGLPYQSFEGLLRTVLPLPTMIVSGVRYVVADGAYGNKTCCIIRREVDWACGLSANSTGTRPCSCPTKAGTTARGGARNTGTSWTAKTSPTNTW